MPLTASRLRKRSIALTMLLVWVFALLSGVANACLTESRGDPSHAGLHAAQPDHVADPAQHDEHPDKAPCQKSCDASSQTLLKKLPKVDAPDLQTAAFPVHTRAVDLHLPRAAPIRAALSAVPPPGPPPRLQYSRLAL